MSEITGEFPPQDWVERYKRALAQELAIEMDDDQQDQGENT